MPRSVSTVATVKGVFSRARAACNTACAILAETVDEGTCPLGFVGGVRYAWGGGPFVHAARDTSVGERFGQLLQLGRLAKG